MIYHLAGVAFPPDANSRDAHAVEVNVGGTISVLRAACRLKRVPTVVIPSSAEIYGAPPGNRLRRLHEGDPIRPTSAYGHTKAAQELAAMAFDRAGAVPVIVARAFNHIGPGQRPEFVVSSFATQLAAVALGQQTPLIRVGNLDSERDFTDVRDVVAAYRLLAVHRLRGDPYNVASGRAVRIGDVLTKLIRISEVAVDVEVDPSRLRATDPPRIAGDNRKLTAATGWRPAVRLETTLRDVWADALGRATAVAEPGAAS